MGSGPLSEGGGRGSAVGLHFSDDSTLQVRAPYSYGKRNAPDDPDDDASPWPPDACTPYRETMTRTVGAGNWGPSEFNGADWTAVQGGGYASVNGTEGVLSPLGVGVGTVRSSEAITLPLSYPIHIRYLCRIMGPDPGDLTFSIGAGPLESLPPGIGVVTVILLYDAPGALNPLQFIAIRTSDGGGGSTGTGTTYPLGATDPAGLLMWVEAILTEDDTSVRCWLDGGSAPDYTVLTGPFPIAAAPGVIEFTGHVGATTDQPDWRVSLVEILCDDSPIAMQRINDEFVFIGDGITSTFTLQYPYAPGSVDIEVDGTDQEVTETDPTTGAIALTFTPAVGETVTASYQRGV